MYVQQIQNIAFASRIMLVSLIIGCKNFVQILQKFMTRSKIHIKKPLQQSKQ